MLSSEYFSFILFLISLFCAFSFRYGSDEDNSSVTSGSGYGAGHSSPHSASQNASQSLPVPQAIVEPLYDQLSGLKVTFQSLDDTLKRLTEEFENYKVCFQQSLSLCAGVQNT